MSVVRPLSRSAVRGIVASAARTYGLAPFSQQISDAADDGHETASTTWVSAGAFNIMVWGYNSFAAGGATTESAMSFTLAGAIPQGTQITSAMLTVQVTANFGAPNFNIYCEDADASSQPGASNRPSTWTPTTATVQRTDLPGAGSLPIDVTALVQEVLDRPGWDGQRINFMVRSNTATGQNNWSVQMVENSGIPVQLDITP